MSKATKEATDGKVRVHLIERPSVLDRIRAALERKRCFKLFFRKFTYCTDFSFLVLVVLGF
jgi:hypothetical protein